MKLPQWYYDNRIPLLGTTFPYKLAQFLKCCTYSFCTVWSSPLTISACAFLGAEFVIHGLRLAWCAGWTSTWIRWKTSQIGWEKSALWTGCASSCLCRRRGAISWSKQKPMKIGKFWDGTMIRTRIKHKAGSAWSLIDDKLDLGTRHHSICL